MQHYNSQYALAMLDLNPDWMAIWLNNNGKAHWSTKQPSVIHNFKGFIVDDDSDIGYIGTFTYDGDWKDTLVVRKCKHFVAFKNAEWKYCPKCGELLGSK